MRFVKMISLVMTDQLRSAVYGSIRQYNEFWRQYDFSPSEEGARAGYHDIAPPEGWEAKGQEGNEGANAYWRR